MTPSRSLHLKIKKTKLNVLIKKDERSQAGSKAFIEKLKKTINSNLPKATKDDFYTLLQDRTLADSAFLAEASDLKKPMFSLPKKPISKTIFLSYLIENPFSDKLSAQTVIDEKLNEFIEKSCWLMKILN